MIIYDFDEISEITISLISAYNLVLVTVPMSSGTSTMLPCDQASNGASVSTTPLHEM
jgi:hypothetical protein